jgi:uncharacterized membrane protein
MRIKVSLMGEIAILAGMSLCLLLLIATDARANFVPAGILQLLLGLTLLLIIPGYLLQAAVFPEVGDLDVFERLALSFGLSIAIIPPLALIIDVLPGVAIRTVPVLIAEGLSISAATLVAYWRRSHLPEGERFVIAFTVDTGGWWVSQDRFNRLLYLVLAMLILVGLVSAGAILLLPGPAESFTEFYVLGPDELAQDFPLDTAAGQAVTVTAGVTNREGVPGIYRIEVQDAGRVIGQAAPFPLEAGETTEQSLTFTPISTGENVRLDLYLYRDGDDSPYRTLRLWLRVE